MKWLKTLVRVFCYTPNKMYDGLKEPTRFLTFFIPFVLFYTATMTYFPQIGIVSICILALWRMGYMHNLYNFSRDE